VSENEKGEKTVFRQKGKEVTRANEEMVAEGRRKQLRADHRERGKK